MLNAGNLLKNDLDGYVGEEGVMKNADVDKYNETVDVPANWSTAVLQRTWKEQVGKGYLGSFMRHCLSVSYVQTSCVKLFERLRRVMYGVKCVHTCLRLHLLHDEGCVDSNKVTAVILVEGLAAMLCYRMQDASKECGFPKNLQDAF